MKSIINIVALLLLFVSTVQAQKAEKVLVYEDAFIQGGETADVAMGVKKPKNMRIFNSQADSKYARIGYLKFKVSKKIESIKDVELHFSLKVYKTEKNPEGKFGLEVYGVEDDKWSEDSITWEEALELGELLGDIEVEQSLDDKNKKVVVKLNAEAFNKLLNGKKDRMVTLALTNDNFNKVSAMAPTKEQSAKAGAYLMIK